MSKRKRIQSGSDDPARKTCEAVAGAFAVSDASKRLIFNAAAVALGHEEEVRTEDGWKRMSQNLLPKVAKPIEVLNSDPQKPPVVFYLASVKALLQLVVKECQNYATLLQKTIASRPGQCLSIILYNDEVTSGNIVAVSTAKKVSLWYFCILEMGRRWSDCMWHPICLLQHADFDNVQGGFSHVAKAIISSIESENLGQGFSVQLPDGYHLLRLELSFMMGDLDAARAGLDQKGSSGIRPCLYCKNVVKKNSQLVTINPMFKEIGSSDIRNFLEQSDSDIFTVYDNLGVTQPTMRKTAFTKKEQCAGFKYNSNGLLADQVLRNVIPPSKWLVDHMHIYWSNGICSWEVVSMFQLWQEQGHGDLTQFLSLDWCTSGGESCTQSWRNFLGHESMFTGNTYKGSASNLMAFFPLFHYFLERTCANIHCMKAGMKSFRSLRRIVMELRSQNNALVIYVEKLQQLQVQHQEDCKAAFGEDYMRPKHHARFHLCTQMARYQFQSDCFPMEQKHRLYKSFIGPKRFDQFARGSRNQKGEYSHLCLQQILQHHIQSLRAFVFTDGLRGGTFRDEELELVLKDTELKCGRLMSFGGRKIAVNDFIIDGEHQGVVKRLCVSSAKLFVMLQMCQLQTKEEFLSTWRLLPERKVIPVPMLGRSPSWWLYLNESQILTLH